MTALDLDGMLRRLHLPTVRRLYPECERRAEAERPHRLRYKPLR